MLDHLSNQVAMFQQLLDEHVDATGYPHQIRISPFEEEWIIELWTKYLYKRVELIGGQ